MEYLKGALVYKPYTIRELMKYKDYPEEKKATIEVFEEVTLDRKAFGKFAGRLLWYSPLIEKYSGLSGRHLPDGGYASECVLIKCEGKKHAIAVCPEGYEYARYAAYIELT